MLEPSGGYYALIKKNGKQFHRALKTKDRKLADRRLKELKGQIGCQTLLSLPSFIGEAANARPKHNSGKTATQANATTWIESKNYPSARC